MMQKLVCHIPQLMSSYEVEINPGFLQDGQRLAASLRSFGFRFAIITDETIAPLYGKPLLHSLTKNGLETFLFTFAAGEQNKTRTTKEQLENQLFEKKLGRDTCLIALGGGVATDLGGYIAATYCRGIPLVTIPTSLLGMVDASIGGKTGVNVPYGKNMLGCVYQPKKVIIDPFALQSLPKKELKNGIAEMIKHGLIADADYFDYLENQMDRLLRLDIDVLGKAIYKSCEIKKAIVEEDEKEKGKRHLLNFGHTVGHALETLSGYSIAHGEAVAIGLLVESHLAVQLGYLKAASFARIQRVLTSYASSAQFSAKDILNAMALDKKSLQGKPRFIIINEIGSPLTFEGTYCTHVEKALIEKSLNIN